MLRLRTKKASPTITAMIVAACLTRLLFLPASSQTMPQTSKVRGYHTNLKSPSEIVGGDKQAEEVQLLMSTLTNLRHGQMDEAEKTLKELVEIAPDEPSYEQLLAMLHRQQSFEGWYRFQSKFGLGNGGGQKIDEPTIPNQKALEDMLVLRLRLATWMMWNGRTSCP